MLFLVETEIHKVKDDSKIKRQTNINRRSPRPIPIICHFHDPPSFSLTTTFNANKFGEYLRKNTFSCDCVFISAPVVLGLAAGTAVSAGSTLLGSLISG
jgi:hypothetical protein